MVTFFRESKATRKAILIFVVFLFCAGAVLNGQSTPTNNLSVGKRHVNIQKLKAMSENILAQNPGTPPSMVYSYLVNMEKKQLQRMAHLDAIGLKPTSSAIRQNIKEHLPENLSINDYSKQQQISPDELVQQTSDSLVQQQLTQAIESSHFITPDDAETHQQVHNQVRHYLEIDLTQALIPDNHAEFQRIYEQHGQNLTSPPTYTYRYIDITPETLAIGLTSEEDVAAYFETHKHLYADQELAYQVTEFSPGKGDSATQQWPKHIHDALQRYTMLYPNNHSTQTQYRMRLSSLTPEDTQLLETLSEGESNFTIKDNTLFIYTLTSRSLLDSVSPKQKEQLLQDTKKWQQQIAFKQTVTSIGEFAYTHPESISALAKSFNLTVYQTSANQLHENIAPVMLDPDIHQHHYLSSPITLSPLHAQVIQLVSKAPEAPLSYEAALSEIQRLYALNILYPSIISELNAAQTLEELTQVCQQHQLTITHQSASIHDSGRFSQIEHLVPTLLSPRPITVTELDTHPTWVQLQRIEYNQKLQPQALSNVGSIDSETFLTSLDALT